MFKALGDEHFLRRLWQWNSSTLAGNNPAIFRVGGPYLGTGVSRARNWIIPPTFSVEGTNWGGPNYGSDFPTEARYVLHYIKIRLIIKQFDEDGQVEVIFLRPRRGVYPDYTLPAPPTMTALPLWPADMDQPYNYTHYNVYWRKKFKYEKYGQAGTEFRREKTLNFFLPIHRMYGTKKGIDATSVEDFFQINNAYENGPYLHMMVRSNDVTSGDSQYFAFTLQTEHKFSILVG